MKLAVLGTGVAGRTLATKLVEVGHEVVMGSRDAANPRAAEWAAAHGDRAASATFTDAARSADIVVNATAGAASLAALQSAGGGALAGKVLIDVANPLDFSHGMPPSLTVCNTDSLGEQIQRAFPKTRVVKTLNTVNADVMVDPGRVPGAHVIFVSGNEAEAKRVVVDLLGAFGWPRERVVDLGGIETARGTESYLLLWVPLMQRLGGPHFNVELAR